MLSESTIRKGEEGTRMSRSSTDTERQQRTMAQKLLPEETHKRVVEVKHELIHDDSEYDSDSSVNSQKLIDLRPDLSFWRLLCLNAFALAYGLAFANFGVILLPEEAQRLWPDKQGIMLGVLLGIAGLSQLISPLVGLASDRTTLSWGRRRPWMILGGIGCALSLPLMWVARYHYIRWLYMLSFFFAMVSLTTSFSSFNGIIPDFVNSNQFGAASGAMGVMQLLGSLMGSLVYSIFQMDVVWSYPMSGGCVIICLIITVLAANETAHKNAPPITWADLANSYWVSPKHFPDFFWVFVIRTFYYMGISVQIFLLYYLRDVVDIEDPKRGTGIVSVIGGCAAATLAYPAGKLSDKIGRKPLVYVACMVMALVYLGFALGRTFFSTAVLCAVYGVANGSFVSVDYALACDVLPSKTNSAKELGVWGIAGFIGTMLGPLIVGPMLHIVGHIPEDPNHYNIPGYVSIMVMGCGYVLCASLFLRLVKAK